MSRCRQNFLVLLLWSFYALTALAADQPVLKRGDVEAVIDGKYAVDSSTYAKYQKCVGDISISLPFVTVAARRQKCKDDALSKSFILPSITTPTPGDGAKEHWRNQVLEQKR